MSIATPTRNTWIVTVTAAAGYAGLLLLLWNAGTIEAADLASNLAVIVGWLLTVGVATYQLSVARLENQEGKRADRQTEMRLQAFRHVADASVDLTKSLSSVMAPFSTAAITLQTPPLFPGDRSVHRLGEVTMQQSLDLTGAWSKFVFAIESFQIVLLPFEHLRKYIGFRIYDASDQIQKLHWSIPHDESAITPEVRQRIATESAAIWSALFEIMTYVGDYRVEVMNALTGDLFDRSVPRRRALHPSKKHLVEVATREAVEAEDERRVQKAILAVDKNQLLKPFTSTV